MLFVVPYLHFSRKTANNLHKSETIPIFAKKYMMTTIQLNAELANQIKLLSGNTDLMKKALDYMKSLTVHMTPAKQANESERTKAFLDRVCGKWEDSRTADEIIADIYAARKNKDDNQLANLFD